MNTAHKGALAFAAKGFPVLPTERNQQTRHVLTLSWSAATTNIDTIGEWNRKWPKANYAVHLEKAGLVCLDLDAKHENQDADAAMARLKKQGKLPETLIVRSQSGGFHIYFKRPAGKLKNLTELPGFPGIEFKANAIMTLPGSFYKNGASYEVVTNGVIATCPDFDLDTAQMPGKPAFQPHDGIPEGQRNSTLTSLAGAMRRKGSSPKAILAALSAENGRCDPPLPLAEVATIAGSVSAYEPEAASAFLDLHLTVVGNAKRLHMMYGAVARWVYPWRQAIVWTGTRWEKDESGHMHRMAHTVVHRLYMAAFGMADTKEAAKVARKALGFEMTSRINGMIEEARPLMQIDVTSLDQHPMLLNTAAGTIDLSDGSVRTASASDLITKISPVAYDPDAMCPRWKKFLLEIMNGDEEMVAFLRRSVGLSLTGDTRDDYFWFLWGAGRNGKTVFLETIERLLGDYAQRTPIETILAGKYDQIPNDIATLAGARFVAATEAGKARRFDVGRLKMLTGGDTVSARFLYKEFFSFKPQFKLWVAANNQPAIDEQSAAIWERLLLIPFRRQFIGANDDKGLEEKLIAELPGILNWAIAGCREWLEFGLLVPKPVKEATEEYRRDEDLLDDFIRANIVKDDASEGIYSQKLFDIYLAHCEDTGVKRSWSQARFSREMKERGYAKERRRAGIVWSGIKIA